MKTITLVRKPLEGSSVTRNVLAHSCGSIYVDGCRVGGGGQRQWTGPRDMGYHGGQDYGGHLVAAASGRWPANMILAHLAGCIQEGTVQTPSYVINRWSDGAKPFGGGAGHKYESTPQSNETVAVWKCVEGCAVAALAEQSGQCPTGDVGVYRRKNTDFYMGHQPTVATTLHQGDSGTATRYFKNICLLQPNSKNTGGCDKQIQEENDVTETIPQDLIDYLVTMISPPPHTDPVVLVVWDPASYDWSQHAERSVHGLLTVGNPEAHMEAIDRVLKPGAHVLLVAPEEEPTGHTGACAIEDFGYEVRDAILLVQEPGHIHYGAKASRSERNLGVVPFKSKQDKVFLKEDGEADTDLFSAKEIKALKSEGLLLDEMPQELDPDDFEANFEVREEVSEFQNNHPTLKPFQIMQRFLEDLPPDAVVLDPFTGSGSTGIACIKKGLNFIGIEREEPYIRIATARLRYHATTERYPWAVEVESEAPDEELPDDPFGGMFGG